MGVKYFKPEDPDAVKYSKPNGSGDVSVRVTRKFRLNLGYTLDNQYSVYQPDQYFDAKKYQIGLDYYLGKNIKAGYSFSAGETTYRMITGEKTGRSDKTEQSDLRVGIRLSGNKEFGIQYTRYTGRSTVYEFTRSYNFIGGYFNHEF